MCEGSLAAFSAVSPAFVPIQLLSSARAILCVGIRVYRTSACCRHATQVIESDLATNMAKKESEESDAQADYEKVAQDRDRRPASRQLSRPQRVGGRAPRAPPTRLSATGIRIHSIAAVEI